MVGCSITIQLSPSLFLQGAVSGSVQATDRLMKELRDIYRSPSFKGGECCWELHGGRFLLVYGVPCGPCSCAAQLRRRISGVGWLLLCQV